MTEQEARRLANGINAREDWQAEAVERVTPLLYGRELRDWVVEARQAGIHAPQEPSVHTIASVREWHDLLRHDMMRELGMRWSVPKPGGGDA